MLALPPDLIALARDRHALLRREEIEAAGVSRRQLDRLLVRRVLERVGRGVYRVVAAPTSPHQAVLTACFAARGVASHLTAAALHRLLGFELRGPIDVLIHEARNCRSTLARLRTTSTIDAAAITIVDGIPTTTVARTLLSLASIAGLIKDGKEISEFAVEDAFDEAITSGKVTQAELAEVLARCRRSGRGGVRLIERLLDQRAVGFVTESHLERAALGVLEDAGVPLPRCQARVAPERAFVARVDFLYEAQRTVIEVSGYRWHRTVEQMERDTERRRDLTELGFRVFEFTSRQIERQPHLLVRLARRILASDAPARAGPVGA